MAKGKVVPQISVIIPAHNEERYIGRPIRSVLNQNIESRDYEIIAIDDASDDRNDRRKPKDGVERRLARHADAGACAGLKI